MKFGGSLFTTFLAVDGSSTMSMKPAIETIMNKNRMTEDFSIILLFCFEENFVKGLDQRGIGLG